ncbi:hypothetical protein K402DRAFT_457 [Aulographum hederae CBS 113979]|uniref:Uncharacterized protein n=1 Tax=Aulographum hederae CBS 113979 TaxID=1176131 RepID=A0A6G1HGG8_9PEZI|nr:hypothetical protein K402DRAFT_457 [Aulographum hederae CBS 113979]
MSEMNLSHLLMQLSRLPVTFPSDPTTTCATFPNPGPHTRNQRNKKNICIDSVLPFYPPALSCRSWGDITAILIERSPESSMHFPVVSDDKCSSHGLPCSSYGVLDGPRCSTDERAFREATGTGHRIVGGWRAIVGM